MKIQLSEHYLNHLKILFTSEEMELAIDNEYFMLAEKATDFLCFSRSLYYDQESLVDLDKIDSSQILLLRIGCVQFISGNGLTAKRPFLNLGMDGFCFLMKFLGFKFKQQSIESSSPDGIIDKVVLQDKTGNEITLYNFLQEDLFKIEPFELKDLPLN